MAEEKRVEDVENTAVATDTAPSSSQQSTQSTASTATVSNKRQRSILDMFTSQDSESRTNNDSKPVVKKTKLGNGTPKITARAAGQLEPLNSLPFALTEYIESIPAEDRKFLELECECMGKSWLKLLKDEIKKPYFIDLKKFLWNEGVHGPNDNVMGKIYPSPRNIYTWSNTPLGKVRVVIVGQDPYHGPNQAHGLCFSVPKGVSVPPSLHNIYKEIKSEYPDFEPPKHGNLTSWAENGVLMLNTCLTVKANQAGSHSGRGWEQFTDKVVDVVDRYGGANLGSGDGSDTRGIGRGVVFLAWGAWAGKRVAKLNKTKHLILTSAHPSPLSARKGFLGNGHFRAANDWLEKKYGAEGKVDWCRLDYPTC